METRCLPADDTAISLGASLLQQGSLVAFPTETVYGLGANALNDDAVRSIFEAKGRPADNPLIVHVGRVQDLFPLCEVDDRAMLAIRAFWPGPLTLLLPKKSVIPGIVTANLPSVAMRMPSHPVAQALLQRCGCPVAAPSANRSGKPSPTRAQHVLEDMAGRIPLILDGGPCSVGLESTVLDMTKKIPMVVRPGGVTPEMLSDILGAVETADSILRPMQAGEKAVSPGMMYRHYAPQGMLTLIHGSATNVVRACTRQYDAAMAAGKTSCIFALTEHAGLYGARYVQDIGSVHHPEEVAERLFDLLRLMDRQHINCIFSEVVDTKGLGLAIMNRLGRAASFHMLDADTE